MKEQSYPIAIPEIIESLFLWKKIYSPYKELDEAFKKSIETLLPINELLIENSEKINCAEGRKELIND